MRIRHRLALHKDDPIWAALDRQGADIDRASSIIWVWSFWDDDPIWQGCRDLILATKGVTSGAVYSKKEIAEAQYLAMHAQGHHGYPQPEDDYASHVYDSEGLCHICGIGKRQIAPFRLRKEFGAKRSSFLQLNWVFDELFVRKPVAEAIDHAGITGMTWRAPVIHRTGEPSADVVQMVIGNELGSALDTSGFQTVTCMPQNEEGPYSPNEERLNAERGYCGRVKYHPKPSRQLHFDRTAFTDVPDVVKTAEWFGSGAKAYQLILVSKKFRALIADSKWRGVSFEPVALMPTG